MSALLGVMKQQETSEQTSLLVGRECKEGLNGLLLYRVPEHLNSLFVAEESMGNHRDPQRYLPARLNKQNRQTSLRCCKPGEWLPLGVEVTGRQQQRASVVQVCDVSGQW